MLRHGRECLDHVQDVDEAAYLRDRDLQLITERLLEIVGEAASRLSQAAMDRIPFDWRGVRGMRNILAHHYGNVQPRLVWAVLKKDLPALLGLVEGRLDR